MLKEATISVCLFDQSNFSNICISYIATEYVEIYRR